MKDMTDEDYQHYYVMRQEAEPQILDHWFGTRVNNATRNITTMQQNETNAVNDKNNNEIDQLSTPPPPEEEPLD